MKFIYLFTNTNTQKKGKLYQAAYDFQAEDESELSMRKGDIVRVTDTTDANWWKADNEKTGACGIVPCQYLVPVNI
jgi:hypothetical protein